MFLLVGLTVPSLLWLGSRLYSIVRKDFGSIRYHISWNAYGVHVVLGGLIPALLAPYLMCCLDYKCSIQYYNANVLRISAVGLLAVNLSAVRLLPHPDRYDSFGTNRRIMFQALGYAYSSSLQFAAMALSTLAFLTEVRLLQISIMSTTLAMYLWTCLVAAHELTDRPWHDAWWARHIWSRLPYGPQAKSKIIQGAVELTRDKGSLHALFLAVLLAGVASALFTARILQSLLLRGTVGEIPPVPPALERFFVVAVQYQTVIMSTAFFTQLQTSFAQKQNRPLKSATYWYRMHLAELTLGQILPIFALALGQPWLGPSASMLDFLWQWATWSSLSKSHY